MTAQTDLAELDRAWQWFREHALELKQDHDGDWRVGHPDEAFAWCDKTRDGVLLAAYRDYMREHTQ